jgi:flagellar export protein FliJ
MKLVVDLAQRAEDESANTLQVVRAKLQQEQTKLAELENYYGEYENRFSVEMNTCSVAQLVQTRSFLQRLAIALEGQKQQIIAVERTLEACRNEWHKRHLKHNSLKDLVARYRIEEARDRDVLEQKMLDEWVSSRPSQNS